MSIVMAGESAELTGQAGSAPIPEFSIVMPCLNEAATLEVCIRKAIRSLGECGIAGEVIIADNGSTDGSQAVAERGGARVVPVERKEYGSALIGGIAAARGGGVL